MINEWVSKWVTFSCLFLLGIHSAIGQNTTIFYKGGLSASGNPANGIYDFQFMLFNKGADGVQQGSTITNSSIGVTNGVFNVTLDFGPVFDGTSRWLDISVRTNGCNIFTELTPRQEVFAVPYALYANSVGTISGLVALSNLPPTVALLTGNQVFTGSITAPSISATLSSNSVVPDSALSADVNLSTSANSQNGVAAYPALNTAVNCRLPWIAYDSSFDPDYGCSPTVTGISNIISLWATNGMLAAGYNMIILDDGWQTTNRPATASQPMPYNTNTFPNGIAPLVAYAHQNGFQFMIYFSEGIQSCCGLASTSGHELADCNEAASWGVDWIYIDYCSGARNSEAVQVLWQSAIYKTGRPISLLMSINGTGDNVSYASELNGWVNGQQTVLFNSPSFFRDLVSMVGQGIDTTNGILGWPQQQGPGHFGNVGIMQVNPSGNPCTTNQLRQALDAFAILGAIFSVDGTPSPDRQQSLSNPEVMAVLKDPLCLRGQSVGISNNIQIIYKPLQSGAAAVALVNNGNVSTNITINWQQIGIASDQAALVHDPGLHKDIGFYNGSYTAIVAAQDITLLVLTPQQSSLSAAAVSGNLSVSNFNGGTNASANSVLAGNGQWVSSSNFWNPNAITNFDTRSLFLNGPVTFGGQVTFATPPVTNSSTNIPLNSIVASYSATNVSGFDSGSLFTPPATGLYEVIAAVALTTPSTAPGNLQINLQFANGGGTNGVNMSPSFDLTGTGGLNGSVIGAFEMSGAQPVSLKSILSGAPTNQAFNVRCSIIRLQ